MFFKDLGGKFDEKEKLAMWGGEGWRGRKTSGGINGLWRRVEERRVTINEEITVEGGMTVRD